MSSVCTLPCTALRTGEVYAQLPQSQSTDVRRSESKTEVKTEEGLTITSLNTRVNHLDHLDLSGSPISI